MTLGLKGKKAVIMDQVPNRPKDFGNKSAPNW
jgi:hypothetical protein